MAGQSKKANGSDVDCPKTIKELQSSDIWLDVEPCSNGYVKSGKTGELRCMFDEIVSAFLNEIFGSNCFRPLPPVLGNGKSVNLFKLYLAVRERGGYEVVSEGWLWGSIATENGLNVGFAASLKLIYAKYLGSLDRWMQSTVNGKDLKGGLEDSEMGRGGLVVDLDSESRGFYSKNSAKKRSGEQVNLDLEESKSKFSGGEMCEYGKVLSCMNVDESKAIGNDRLFGSSVVCESDSSKDKLQNDEVQSFVQLNGNDRSGNDEHMTGVDPCDINLEIQGKEDICCRKRKRECSLGFMDWMKKVAKDPCDPTVGCLPEMSKWKKFTSDQPWKQALLVREARLVKRNADSSAEQSVWQKRQKMHPTMYDDNSVSGRSRHSERIVSAKISRDMHSFKKSQARPCSEAASSGTQSDLEDTHGKRSESRLLDSLAGLWITNYSRKRIPKGKNHQAEVPEWTEKAESDSKWLGKRLWPQEEGMNRNNLIERDRTGFGRHDQCGCEFKGSFECVRFHVSEKRNKLKLELGLAFCHWQIDQMGEEVAVCWNKVEETNFEAIIRSNPPSQGKYFWDELCKFFPYKKREQLVSYYFNVFLLRRRGQQNRSIPIEINSDDDDLEFETTTNCTGQTAVKSPKPNYCSPKKTHLNFRDYSKTG